jgi:hypothetical protein
MRGVPSLVLVTFRTAIGASGAMVTTSPARPARHRGHYGRGPAVAGGGDAERGSSSRPQGPRPKDASESCRPAAARPLATLAANGWLPRPFYSLPRLLAPVRWVSIPLFLLPDVAEHLEQFTSTADDQLIFTGPKGAQLRRSNVTRQWRKALEAARLTEIHFHDLRHTGNTLAGEAGASLRELMDRMGHSTTRAALIYQHRTSLRDRMIADEISRRAEAARTRSGAQRARDNGEAS